MSHIASILIRVKCKLSLRGQERCTPTHCNCVNSNDRGPALRGEKGRDSTVEGCKGEGGIKGRELGSAWRRWARSSHAHVEHARTHRASTHIEQAHTQSKPTKQAHADHRRTAYGHGDVNNLVSYFCIILSRPWL